MLYINKHESLQTAQFNAQHPCIFSRANTGINTSTFTISFRPQMKKSKVSFIKGVGGKTVLKCKPNTGKKNIKV